MRVAVLASALVLCAAACSGGDESATSSASEAELGATTAPAVPPLAAPPADCRSQAPHSRPPGFRVPVIGREAAWMGVYAPTFGEALLLPPDTPYTEDGWRIKVLWLLPAAYEHPVTVRSLRVGGGNPALIETGAVPRTEVVLDPANPGAYSNPKTADFPSSLYFPEAGCYAFEVAWPGGGWRAVLAVGA